MGRESVPDFFLVIVLLGSVNGPESRGTPLFFITVSEYSLFAMQTWADYFRNSGLGSRICMRFPEARSCTHLRSEKDCRANTVATAAYK